MSQQIFSPTRYRRMVAETPRHRTNASAIMMGYANSLFTRPPGGDVWVSDQPGRDRHTTPSEIWRSRPGPGRPVTPFKWEEVSLAPVPTDWLRGRLEDLQEAASEEGIVWDQASEAGMWAFFERFNVSAQPFVTLRFEGRLRALWENPAGEQIGLQFLDGERIHYVIFSTEENGRTGQHYGTGNHAMVQSIIEAVDVVELLYA